MKPETAFRQNRVVPFLNSLLHTAVFPIQQLAISGDPDFLLCMQGRFVALEIKDRGEVPRPLQQYKLDQVVRTRGVALVADPDNWEQIKSVLSQYDRGHFI
jgi:hypothetical protein